MSLYGIIVFIGINSLNSSTMFIAAIYKTKEKE